jgi:hypothetical protein
MNCPAIDVDPALGEGLGTALDEGFDHRVAARNQPADPPNHASVSSSMRQHGCSAVLLGCSKDLTPPVTLASVPTVQEIGLQVVVSRLVVADEPAAGTCWA